MHIRSMEIGNFRGLISRNYEDEVVAFQSLTFDPQLNVIIGVNGIGKTSILDALRIMLLRIFPLITAAPNRKQKFSPKDPRAAESEITGMLSIDFDGVIFTYRIAQHVAQARVVEDIPKADIHQLAALYDKAHPRSNTPTPIALLYTTDRAGYRLADKSPTETLPGRAAAYHGALIEKMVNYGQIALWLNKHRTLAPESPRDAHILRATEEALRRFLPAFGDLEEETQPPRLFIRKKGIRLSIDQLSDGERSFLAMVIDIARHLALANPGVEEPLREGRGVVLIDEIELHLHPQWQRNVVPQLQETFPGVQFITTTHSPFVIQSLKPGQLINLDPESYEEGYADEYADKSIEDISEDVMGIELPQKSQRYLDMMKTAEEYYRIVHKAKGAPSEELEALKHRLDELSIPYSDDAAFTAFLKFQRESVLREDEADQ